jgi:hypothetical protein
MLGAMTQLLEEWLSDKEDKLLTISLGYRIAQNLL